MKTKTTELLTKLSTDYFKALNLTLQEKKGMFSRIKKEILINKKQRKKNLIINYDNEADVLYISFDSPEKADDTEFFSNDILVRKKNKAIVGLTLLHFKKSLLS